MTDIETQMPSFDDQLFFMPKSVARRRFSEDLEAEQEQFEREHLVHLAPFAHKHITPIHVHKLREFFVRTLDRNADGVINWKDFEKATEAIVPLAEANKDSRLRMLRRGLEKDFEQYFADLREKGDVNQDGNIDVEEWLDVMDEIIYNLQKGESFPSWYEGLFKILFRSQDFDNEKSISRDEFIELLQTWNFDEEPAGKAFDYITKNGAKSMDYCLFLTFMKEFFTNGEQGHPVNCGLDLYKFKGMYESAGAPEGMGENFENEI